MALAIKEIVSKNKIRYKGDGFDLDLSYIATNIIAMGFPAGTLERFYRNDINDVAKFFESKHKNQYKIYNLCSESKRRYDTSKFKGRVVEEYSFQDHYPPPFYKLKPFCESVHRWLSSDSNNVAAIHCKAGKGRTGVMICAYLVHAGGCKTEYGYETIADSDSALEYYGRHRTHDSKGVTIPSQKRYVYYYEDLVKRQLEYRTVRLRLTSLMLTSVPNYNNGQTNFTLQCEVYRIPKQKIKTFDIEVRKGSKYLMFNQIPEDLYLEGDIKLEFFIKKIKKEKIFQFCFNTFFVAYGSRDAYTVIVEPCQSCHHEKWSVLSHQGKSEKSQQQPLVYNESKPQIRNSMMMFKPPNSSTQTFDDSSVMMNRELMFLEDLLFSSNHDNQQHLNQHNCDCPSNNLKNVGSSSFEPISSTTSTFLNKNDSLTAINQNQIDNNTASTVAITTSTFEEKQLLPEENKKAGEFSIERSNSIACCSAISHHHQPHSGLLSSNSLLNSNVSSTSTLTTCGAGDTNSKMSTSVSSTSSSSSMQSLLVSKKINNNGSFSNHNFQSQNSKSSNKNFYYVLPKNKLDKAYKDKDNKIFQSDFKVVLKFSHFFEFEDALDNETELSSSSSSREGKIPFEESATIINDSCCLPSSTNVSSSDDTTTDDDDESNSDQDQPQRKPQTVVRSSIIVNDTESLVRENSKKMHEITYL